MIIQYEPRIFNVDTLDRARAIILNPDGVHSPEERWQVETEYLLKIMTDWLPLRGAVLDWGCGIGRLAKPLIEQHGCAVLGADISQSMRGLAVSYVNSPDFLACDPSALHVLGKLGLRFDCALAVWVLQHVLDLEADLATLKSVLNPGGRLFVLSTLERSVPASVSLQDSSTQFQWANDGVNILGALERVFVRVWCDHVDLSIIPTPVSFWGVFERATVE